MKVPFNPHFTRTLSETEPAPAYEEPAAVFQSSFYKDTLWNRAVSCSCIQPVVFQSSFYKDTLWNKMYEAGMNGWKDLSILILQGHSLKRSGSNLERGFLRLSILILQGHSLKQNAHWKIPGGCIVFQSSFYKDTLWNVVSKAYNERLRESFNPHFTRTLSETTEGLNWMPAWAIFQSSFYKDTLWNSFHGGRDVMSIHSFNPHFTRTLSETNKCYASRFCFYAFNPHFTRTLSETWVEGMNNLRRLNFQSSFYKDTLWNQFQSRHNLQD